MTQAIKVNSSHLLKPEILTEEDVSAELVSNENEIILEKVEEEQMAMLSEDDDSDDGDATLNNNFFHQFHLYNSNKKNFATTETTLTDSENWR